MYLFLGIVYFINQNVEAEHLLYPKTGANLQPSHQSAVRGLAKKISFVTDVTCAIADSIGVDGFLNVQNQLSELIQGVETIRALVRTAEREFTITEQEKQFQILYRWNCSWLTA